MAPAGAFRGPLPLFRARGPKAARAFPESRLCQTWPPDPQGANHIIKTMNQDLSPIFQSYETLRNEADAIFNRVSGLCPGLVKCGRGCSDCCHALFDLSLVEAMRLNQAFARAFEYGPERSAILERAGEADRRLTRLKRGMFRAERDGSGPEEIMARAAHERIRCPLLDDNGDCLLYEERPIICRLYGIPLDIGGKSHVCGFSGFDRGEAYPAARLSKIQERLEAMSAQIGKTIGSRFDLADVYVPLSMALLTNYDDAWLGVGDARED